MPAPSASSRSLKPAIAGRLLPVLLLAILLSAGVSLRPIPARAAGSDDDPRIHEVDRRGEQPPAAHPAAQFQLSVSPGWTGYLARHPGWVARWNEALGTVESAAGPATPMPGAALLPTGTGPQADRVVELAAREFMTSEMAAWLPSPDRLVFLQNKVHRGNRWVSFTQQEAGIPVFNSLVTLFMGPDGRVAQFVNRSFPSIHVSTQPAITADAAVVIARAGLPEGTEPLEAPALAILPLAKGGGYDHRLTWRVEFRTRRPMGHWINFVDAGSATLLWRFNNARSGAVNGKVTADVERGTAGDTPARLPLPYLQVTVINPDKTTSTAFTDTSGAYNLSTPGVTGRQIRARLGGRYGRVYDNSLGLVTPTILDSLPDGSTNSRAFLWDDANSTLAQRDPYWSAMISHDYVQAIEPGFNLLDYAMPIIVELDQTCNAYWDGVGINFFAAGGGCPASGRIATIVMHEYCHGLTDFIYRPLFCPADMNEGFSDYYCCTIVNDPVNGPGFHGPGTYVRRIDVDRKYPEDMTGEEHNDGLVIGSALWDLREILGRTLSDQLFHFARYGRAQSFDEYFMDYLRVDDDDFDIYNGTPHFTAIANTFRKHGVGDFSIRVSHAGTLDTEDTGKTFPLTASFLSLFALKPGSVQAHITLAGANGSYEVLDPVMTATGGVREYTTLLGSQPAGTRVSYYFTASDTAGADVTWPPEGALAPFTFRVGVDTTPPVVQHDALPDQPADVSGVLVRAAVGDNLDRGLGPVCVRYRADGGTASTLVMTLAADGSYRAELPVTGLARGALLEYRIEASDDAQVPNTRLEPANGWHGFRLVGGFGRDFEADGGGLVGGGDWQWGEPGSAWSGTHAWSTALAGSYTDTTTSILELPPVDLSGFARAALTFRHRMLSEEYYDGGTVEISIDGGGNWWSIAPDGDYAMSYVWSVGGPGFSGRIDDWQPAEFDLSAYRGFPDVRLRLRFESDQSVNGPGWLVDDVQVVERQILSRPLGLASTRGEDGAVSLSWGVPGGIIEWYNNPVVGYRVYRATTPAGTPVPLIYTPIPERTWNDGAVENGRRYYYWVSAVYADGESPPVGPVEGYPYRPAFAASSGSVSLTLAAGSTTNAVLTVSNARTGDLKVNTFLATAGQTIDDVRIRLTTGDRGPSAAPARREAAAPAAGEASDEARLAELPARLAAGARPLPERRSSWSTPAAAQGPNPYGWDTLFVDPRETPAVVPDLGPILVQQTDTDIYFRVTAWENWGNTLADFNLVILLNTDGDESSGFSGGDYMLVAGPIMFNNYGVVALILDGNQNPVAWPSHLLLQDGTREAEFGIPKDAIGRPAEILLTFAALNAGGSIYLDRAPNRPSFAWLTTPARHVEASPGSPAPLTLAFKTSGVRLGAYQARLYFTTNDPDLPLVLVPLSLTVNASTPVVLAGFEAVCGADGVRLSWRTTGETDHAGFHVYRRETEPAATPEERLNPGLLATEADGSYRFLDAGAAAGHRYEYRLADVSRGGEMTFHGPFPVSLPAPVLPARAWLGPATPNPVRGAAVIRYGLPAPGPATLRVFDVEGRLVRTLLDLPLVDAGYHDVSWDVRDDGGRLLGAGVYFCRLEAAGRVETGKVMVAR